MKVPNGRRKADRIILAGLGRVPNPTIDVPTIVVEFVSKRKRDRIRDYEEKRREYLASGVAEYWLIDRFQKRMTACRHDGSVSIVLADQIYRTPLLPGFELVLDRLFLMASDWA